MVALCELGVCVCVLLEVVRRCCGVNGRRGASGAGLDG